MAIPLHLIGGYLGVGKTTAIRRFVAAADGYTAVVVNDFGRAGYDAAMIAGSGAREGLHVENVPGGCLCCTSSGQLLTALEACRALPGVRRMILEPSGLALLAPLLDRLREAAPRLGLELRPVIVVFDAAKTRPVALRQIPYWRHLAELAEIVVLNRCDGAGPGAAEELAACFSGWVPAKRRIVQTSFGALPPEVFELSGHAAAPAVPLPCHAELPPAGTLRSEARFSLAGLRGLLERRAAELARFKGVFQTDRGRFALEVAGNRVDVRPAPSGAGSAAEWVGAGEEMSVSLSACALHG